MIDDLGTKVEKPVTLAVIQHWKAYYISHFRHYIHRMRELNKLCGLAEEALKSRETILDLKKELSRTRSLVTYTTDLLGPIAKELMDRHKKNGLVGAHVSWGPDAFTKLDGEGRAAILLKASKASDAHKAAGGKSNPPMSGRKPMTIDEHLATRKFDDPM